MTKYVALTSAMAITIYFRIWVIIIICLLLGTGIGDVNGFIITLGTMYIARGFANIRSGGATFPNLQGRAELKTTGFEILGSGRSLAILLAIWLMLLIALITIYFARKTPLGRHI